MHVCDVQRVLSPNYLRVYHANTSSLVATRSGFRNSPNDVCGCLGSIAACMTSNVSLGPARAEALLLLLYEWVNSSSGHDDNGYHRVRVCQTIGVDPCIQDITFPTLMRLYHRQNCRGSGSTTCLFSPWY